MAKPKPIHDLIIAGATPAGTVAAWRGRQLGLSCLLLEPGPWPPPARLDWLGPAGVELLGRLGLETAALEPTDFAGLGLHSWDLKRHTRVTDANLAGWIVDRRILDAALLAHARQAGAELLPVGPPEALTLGEDCVTVHLPGHREARGRILLIADGLDSHTTSLARMPPLRKLECVVPAAEVHFNTQPSEAGIDLVIGARRLPQMLTILRAGRRGRVRLVSRDAGTPPEQQLREFLVQARAAGLLPEAVTGPVQVAQSPAGAALEAETLVGKRALQIGEAGGFIAGFSDEAIFPAAHSGWVAADVAHAALAAPVLQDELQSFSSAWRTALADYLRMPNTDLSLLMPLVFNNTQMSARVARAFLLGQTF